MDISSLELTKKIASILDSKKAMEIEAIHVRDLTIIADYFIIASGTSNTQVKALADEIDFQLSQIGIKPTRVEGYNTATWILLDYANVLVHVFQQGTRDFYSLERLWSDGEKLDLSDVISHENNNK